MKDKLLSTHSFLFNKNDNGGESVRLVTKFIGNGDKITHNEGIFTNQEFSLQSYGNSASINLFGVSLTPESLRDLANELEIERNKLINF
ncbi:MAG: hypothetical protein AABY22_15940 [Nanoarchaeota archaeon]